ncbi:MAG: SusD/RagB family nutrient-binding outer membrane lipoprotein [Gemmatimonadaceae bacterium]|nr:SusD/RagB family nutrient-binding outer membrane lipoprotein [Gemmatimonadaceae bacterium]
MQRNIKAALAAVALIATAGACKDYLSGPKLDENPNLQTEVRTPNQYFVGIQAAAWSVQEGGLARTAGIWHQQFAGVDRQYSSTDIYSVGEDDYSSDWNFIFAQGGLIDIRKLRAEADKVGDKKYSGIAKIYEAWEIGTAASIWGDIPYSEANKPDITSPKLDKQLDVYAALQTLLSSAITDLQSGTGAGPGGTDLVYGGSSSRWIAVANTLKARFYMHTGEVTPAAYALANAAAKQGISSAAGDYLSFHSEVPTEWNVWSQFSYYSRDTYMRAGKALVDTMKNRADNRLTNGCSSGQNWCSAYFDGTLGSAPGQNLSSASNISEPRLYGPTENLDFRQPLITWAETQLIIAETAFRSGNLVEALTAVNAVRTAAGNAALTSVTLSQIATEKYIADFQTIEVWNDYKRLCLPKLTPAPGKSQIPARLVYPFSERNANSNIPAPSAQVTRNQNDPNACT